MDLPEHVLVALDQAHVDLEDGKLDEASAGLDAIEPEASDVPELHFLRGRIAVEREQPDAAFAAFEHAVSLDETYADAHYALADVARHRGDDARAIEHDIIVWRLDQQADAQLSRDELQDALQLIEGEAERILSALPEPFRSAVSDVPILVEERPSEALVRSGFDPRALGLFEGPMHAERSGPDAPPSPTHIVLYWTNILDIAEDDQVLAEELEITLLHEIGHYFGLDEEQVAALGLA